MARSQQNSAGNKTATKSKKSTQTKSVSKSGAKNCSNCSNCKESIVAFSKLKNKHSLWCRIKESVCFYKSYLSGELL